MWGMVCDSPVPSPKRCMALVTKMGHTVRDDTRERGCQEQNVLYWIWVEYTNSLPRYSPAYNIYSRDLCVQIEIDMTRNVPKCAERSMLLHKSFPVV
jgi:hypothetical protein